MAKSEQLIPSDKIHVSTGYIVSPTIINFIIHDSTLYCSEWNIIRRWTNDKWVHFAGSDPYGYITCLGSFMGQLYSGHYNGDIWRWTEQGQCDLVVNDNSLTVYNLTVVEEKLYSAGSWHDGIVCCWDHAGQKLESSIPPCIMTNKHCVVFEEMIYAVLFGDYHIRAWSIGSGKYLHGRPVPWNEPS